MEEIKYYVSYNLVLDNAYIYGKTLFGPTTKEAAETVYDDLYNKYCYLKLNKGKHFNPEPYLVLQLNDIDLRHKYALSGFGVYPIPESIMDVKIELDNCYQK